MNNYVEQIQKRFVSKVYRNNLLDINDGKLFLKNTKVKIRDLLINSSILILRFSIFNCSACIHFALDKLLQGFKDFKSNKRILLIYDDENMRVYESTFGKISYVSTNRNVLGLPIESTNTPSLFILDNDLKNKQFFVPEKEMPELTDEYLSIIKRRYFDNDKKSSGL